MFYPSKLLKKYQDKYCKKPNLEDLLASFSVYVWEELRFMAKVDVRMSKVDERTFTNTLINEVARQIIENKNPLPIRLFHSVNENVNGSDLEIVVQIAKDHNIVFACQAKRLYIEESQGNVNKAVYKAFDHKIGKSDKQQIDCLLEYGEKIKAIPLYILYSYVEELKSGEIPAELFGSSILSANYLKNNFSSADKLKTFKFADVYKFVRPIHLLFDSEKRNTVLDDLLSGTDVTSFYHSDSSITKNKNWLEPRPPISVNKTRNAPDVLSLSKLLSVKTEKTVLDDGFNPAFRIYVTADLINNRDYLIDETK